MWSVKCGVWSGKCGVWSVECEVWRVECGAFCCVYVCLCLCLSLYGREVTVDYARLLGGMGATFCHLAALRLLNFSSGIIGKRLFWAKS